MFLIKISDEGFENVKHVLFGLQKQANVTNEAVTKLVAATLIDQYGDDALATEESVIKHLTEYFQAAVDGFVVEETIILLVGGEVSITNLESMGPNVVVVDQPSPDSPKHTFRIGNLGEEAEVDRTVEVDDEDNSHIRPTESPDSKHDVASYENDDDIVAYTAKLKDDILSVSPKAVIDEFAGNDYAAALYLYKAYLKANS